MLMPSKHLRTGRSARPHVAYVVVVACCSHNCTARAAGSGSMIQRRSLSRRAGWVLKPVQVLSCAVAERMHVMSGTSHSTRLRRGLRAIPRASNRLCFHRADCGIERRTAHKRLTTNAAAAVQGPCFSYFGRRDEGNVLRSH